MGSNDTKQTAPAAPAAAPTPAAPAAAAPIEEDSLKGKTSFDVYSGATLVRTYDVETHGPKAGDLAKEYAGKIQGTVK